jgi:hypothetical protein
MFAQGDPPVIVEAITPEIRHILPLGFVTRNGIGGNVVI